MFGRPVRASFFIKYIFKNDSDWVYNKGQIIHILYYLERSVRVISYRTRHKRREMCCITLDAKMILNNFFGSPEFKNIMTEQSVNLKTMKRCSVFISNNLPGYVVCDLSNDSIMDLELDGNIAYNFQDKTFKLKHKIDRKYYNRFYPKAIATELEESVDFFIKEKLYEKDIELTNTLLG